MCCPHPSLCLGRIVSCRELVDTPNHCERTAASMRRRDRDISSECGWLPTRRRQRKLSLHASTLTWSIQQAQCLDTVPQHCLLSGTPCAHDVIVNHCNSCPSHSPIGPLLLGYSFMMLAPHVVVPRLRLLSSPSLHHATSKAAAGRKPSSGKGHALTERMDRGAGSRAEFNRRPYPSEGCDKWRRNSHCTPLHPIA